MIFFPFESMYVVAVVAVQGDTALDRFFDEDLDYERFSETLFLLKTIRSFCELVPKVAERIDAPRLADHVFSKYLCWALEQHSDAWRDAWRGKDVEDISSAVRFFVDTNPSSSIIPIKDLLLTGLVLCVQCLRLMYMAYGLLPAFSNRAYG